MSAPTVAERLEYLRAELRAERMSYGELHELQNLAPHIDPGDVELLEAAGVAEFDDMEDNDGSDARNGGFTMTDNGETTVGDVPSLQGVHETAAAIIGAHYGEAMEFLESVGGDVYTVAALATAHRLGGAGKIAALVSPGQLEAAQELLLSLNARTTSLTMTETLRAILDTLGLAVVPVEGA